MSGGYPTDVFHAVEAQVAMIAETGGPFADGDAPDAFPLQLHAARDAVLDPRTSSVSRDAVWAELIQRVRTGDQIWQEIAIWMMIPKFRAITHGIRRGSHAELSDLRSDTAAPHDGHVHRAPNTDPDVPRALRAAHHGGPHHRRACPGRQP
jgi:hypothetical protein